MHWSAVSGLVRAPGTSANGLEALSFLLHLGGAATELQRVALAAVDPAGQEAGEPLIVPHLIEMQVGCVDGGGVGVGVQVWHWVVGGVGVQVWH